MVLLQIRKLLMRRCWKSFCSYGRKWYSTPLNGFDCGLTSDGRRAERQDVSNSIMCK
jgi:hypothetical protein